jgi:hypothetical protein
MPKKISAATGSAVETSIAVQPTPSGYLNLANTELVAELAAELNATDVTFARIVNPGSGGNTFEISGADGEPESVKEFSGVILHAHPMNLYYMEKFNGESKPPNCASMDGVVGEGEPGGGCRKCPLNAYDSGENGAKACKNRYRLFILREGDYLPTVFSVPSSNLRAFKAYRAFLSTRGSLMRSVVTQISIDKRSGKQYVQFVFKKMRDLTPEERAVVDPFAMKIKEYSERWSFDEDLSESEIAEIIDPETGEITRPLAGGQS